MPTTKTAHRYFGNVRKLPSGRFQARYIGRMGNAARLRASTVGH